MCDRGLPVIDLSPFWREGDQDGKKKVIQSIGDACSEYGFFQIVNHGMPSEIMSRALEHTKTFFSYSEEEKLRSRPKPDVFIPAGYKKQPDNSPNNNEFFSMFPPGSSSNVYPSNPPGFREVLDEIFLHFMKMGRIIESILSECLGLPPNFLTEYNDERKCDLLTAFHYYPAKEKDNTGVYAHKDSSFITFVLQDEVGGLEVQKDEKWVPIIPIEGSLVVNVGDAIQVLSNDRFVSATHRVVTQPGRNRYSYAFAYMLDGEKWVEPLSQVAKEIEGPPRYRGFKFGEYIELRFKDLTNPPSKPEDLITISHYAIPA